MTSWFSTLTSGFPTLPSLPSLNSFALPSGLQRRFISFVLRRALGKFVKPGQLDEEKIDSQIGSGYVRVANLELDHDSINTMLLGLPLQLQHGSIALVNARVPWPNPLTSTLGLSIDSLHLTLNIVEPSTEGAPASPIDLSQSVASVADAFIQDEMNQHEEDALHESLRQSTLSLHERLPGGFDVDPFTTGNSQGSEADVDDAFVFSALVEHLVARFQFSAVNTRIIIVKPGVATFTVYIPEIRYGLVDVSSGDLKKAASLSPESTSPTPAPLPPQARTVTITGFKVTTRSLRQVPTLLRDSPSLLTATSTEPTSPLSLSVANEGSRTSYKGVEPYTNEPLAVEVAETYDPVSFKSPLGHPPIVTSSTNSHTRDKRPLSPLLDIRPPSPSSGTASPTHTNDDMRGEVPEMVQSLVSLPPRTASPASSVGVLSGYSGSSPQPVSPVSSFGGGDDLSRSIVSLPPQPPSPTKSDASAGHMAQSLLSLPPRAHSPASSLASSMYQSALYHSAYSAAGSDYGDPVSEELEATAHFERTTSNDAEQRIENAVLETHINTPSALDSDHADDDSKLASTLTPHSLEPSPREDPTLQSPLLSPITNLQSLSPSLYSSPHISSSPIPDALSSSNIFTSSNVSSAMSPSSIPSTTNSPLAPPLSDASPSPGHAPSDSDPSSRPEEHAFEEPLNSDEAEEETILTIKSEPITISLSYLSLQASSLGSAVSTTGSRKSQISISMGVIACTLRAAHLHALIEISTPFTKPQPKLNPSMKPAAKTSVSTPAANLRLRGLTLLLLPKVADVDASWIQEIAAFHEHPLIPPRLKRGYVRLFVDGITANCGPRLVSPTTATSRYSAPTKTSAPTLANQASLTIADISIFSFHTRSTGGVIDGNELDALPILITDPYLPSQYNPLHSQPDGYKGASGTLTLPTFSIVDWTDRRERFEAAKPSRWRVRPPTHQRRSSGLGVAGVGLATSPTSPSKTGVLASIQRGLQPTPALFATVSIGSNMAEEDKVGTKVTVRLAPLHAFFDLGMLLEGGPTREGSQVLEFIADCVPSPIESFDTSKEDSEDEGDAEVGSDHDVPQSKYSTPRVRTTQLPNLNVNMQHTLQHLERSVVDDLELNYDYRQRQPLAAALKKTAKKKTTHASATGSTLAIRVEFPMIRAQVRCPPPRRYSARSGALVMDFHEFAISQGERPEANHRQARFAAPSDINLEELSPSTNVLVSMEWSRALFSHSLSGQRQAAGIVSVGPSVTLDAASNNDRRSGSLDETPFVEPVPQGVSPRLEVSRPVPKRLSATSSKTVVGVHLPGVLVLLNKPLIDGLQLWADDASQLLERAMGDKAPSGSASTKSSRDPSLIGSRFFAKPHTGESRSTSGSEHDAKSLGKDTQGETVIKAIVSEAYVRLMVSRTPDRGSVALPFDITASGIDALLELKPEGKEETVVTVAVADIRASDVSSDNKRTYLLHTTKPLEVASNSNPMVKLRFRSYTVPQTIAKESSVRVTLAGFTYNLRPDFAWASDLGLFFKAPPGAFESVVPSERTRVTVKVSDGSIHVMGATQSAAAVLYLSELELATDLVGDSTELLLTLGISSTSLMLNDDALTPEESREPFDSTIAGTSMWKSQGFVTFVDIEDLQLALNQSKNPAINDTRLSVEHMGVRIHLCADTVTAISTLAGDFTLSNELEIQETPPKENAKPAPTAVYAEGQARQSLMASLDEHAFRRSVPQVGPVEDLIEDYLPSNLDYLDESFGAAAGLRELDDDDLDEFSVTDIRENTAEGAGLVSAVGGETIQMLADQPLRIIEHYYDTLPQEANESDSSLGDTTFRLRLHNCNLDVLLYDGYDWPRTRRTIEEETKAMRRKLAKIRQMLASGHDYDPSAEDTGALLYNSVYVGLDKDLEGMDQEAMIAAIDEELHDDDETASQSSWQSLKPQSNVPIVPMKSSRTKTHRLVRAAEPSIEFRLLGADIEFDQHRPDEPFASRALATVRDLEILDHIKTSTWGKFLTDMRSDIRGNIRETNSNMVRVELVNVRPVPGNPSVEARLRAKLLPLRLHVDQDALDFLKQFFAFKLPSEDLPSDTEGSKDNTYFQHVEVFPVDLKLDYKPKRVDYRALRAGKTIELMNFFHFDGSEMTLRHITLHGITGWARLGDTLNDLWTPDVKATQLVDVISGVAPIRSVVNVGSGVADLVLLPIAQYKKDGRVVRGMRKGATAFMRSTGMEALRLGARLATGTQVILEQAESVLGTQYAGGVTAEAVQPETISAGISGSVEEGELFSRYAEQPMDVREGIQSAYTSLRRNFNSAAQTILAVPMEVYERSGNEGPVRAVVRAVPIAVLKPMIGASEAVSKTLLGIHNTFDPDVRQQTEAKYKQR